MKKILIIEDNYEIRENTAEILELANYAVDTAENGKVGVEKAKLIQPDVIICDIMMPELDGYGVLNILTKNPETSGIPFIFLTAKSERSDLRKGMNLGADDYIVKPFEEIDLLEAIETRIKRNESIRKEVSSDHADAWELIKDGSGLKALRDLSVDRKEKTYAKKEEVYREGDYANYLYFLISGKIKCIKTDSYGKDFVTEIHSPNEFFGYMTLLEDNDYHESAIAMEESKVAIVPKRDFLALIQKNREVATQFIKRLSGNVREKEKRLLQLAYAPVRERVADALLQLSTESSTINVSREDLASIVGTAKESLIRMLSDLKKENLILISGRQIEVLEREKLNKMAVGH